MASKGTANDKSAPRRPVAKTPEGREMQLQSLAFDLVEKRLRDGSASASETTYLLKAASTRNKLEEAKLRSEGFLAEARADQVRSLQGQEELQREAIRVFTQYQGKDGEEEDESIG